MNDLLLKVDGLKKSFDNTEILRGVSFAIKAGEVVSLVGRSGAGKTTVLRCVTGLEECDGGNIEINGEKLCENTENGVKRANKRQLYSIRKNIGMVFQSYHLFPHKTVLQNVTLALTEVHKTPKDEADAKATAMLERLGLKEQAQKKPAQLSGGQKQRVAIARSCVANPKLLCFDEPTAALDSSLANDIVEIIRSFAKEGMGILTISHDEKFVEKVSDRVLIMEQGRIKADISPSEYADHKLY